MERTGTGNHPLVFEVSGVKPRVSTDVHSLDMQEWVQLTQEKPRTLFPQYFRMLHGEAQEMAVSYGAVEDPAPGKRRVQTQRGLSQSCPM